ncbi:ankyrin repeat-containing domain protein [Aspergillus undulatus]|uniref:ankyrin repeat-containing domain protein n=1 Tax=Aspergillus undulatus TaxID=1810928 RepID=UPI003CCCFDFB
MVEPIGLVGTLIAIVQVCGKLVFACYDYHAGVRDAPQDISRILDEISSFGTIAQQPIKVADADKGSALPALEAMNMKNGPFPNALIELQELKKRLKTGKLSTFKRDLVWPLKRVEVEKHLQALGSIKNSMQLALAADNTQNTVEILGSSRLLPGMEKKVNELIVSKEALEKSSRRRKLLEELDGCNQLNKFQSEYRKCAPGTGEWLLYSTQYKEWKTNCRGPLWVKGNAGSGKTVLCSRLINELRHHCAAERSSVCYFFVDASEERATDIDSVCRALIRQLVDQGGPLPSVEWPFGGWQKVLHKVLNDSGSTYLVFGGIDECDEYSQVSISDMARLIKGVVKSCPPGKVHVAVFSRDLEQLRAEFEQLTVSTVCTMTSSLKRTTETFLLAQAHGSFRWLDCQLQELGRCKTPHAVTSALNRLPVSLEEYYNRVLDRFEDSTRESVKNLLLWVTFALRPLSIAEVTHAMAVRVDSLEVLFYDSKLEPFDPEGFIDSCSTLVTTFQSEDQGATGKRKLFIKLAHFTVREFLTSEVTKEGPSAVFFMDKDSSNLLLAKASVSLFHHAVRSCPDAKDIAKANWQGFGLQALLQDLFDDEQPFFKLGMQIANIDRPWVGEASDSSFHYTALYCAAYCGLAQLVQKLIAKGLSPIESSGLYGCPLQAAAFNGHLDVVRLLIEQNVDVNAKGGALYTALSAAASKGHMGVAEALMEAGALMCELLLRHDAEDYHELKGMPPSALVAAVKSGRIDIVKALLRSEKVIEGQRGDPLASEFALLPCGVQKDEGLGFAAMAGDKQTVRQYLEEGADPESSAFRDGVLSCKGIAKPLASAAYWGHLDMVRELLCRSADPNDNALDNGSPLGWAVKGGNVEVAKLLIESGADINLHSPLATACSIQRTDLIDLLLEHGADTHGVLREAAKRGDEEVFNHGLTLGADPNSPNTEKYPSMLALAARGGSPSIIKYLLDHGLQPELNPSAGDILPLHVAICARHSQAVDTLVELSADVNSSQQTGAAEFPDSRFGTDEIIDLLIQHGAMVTPSTPDTVGTPLLYAVWNKEVSLVEKLITKGVNLNQRGSLWDMDNRTFPLVLAAETDNLAMLSLLFNAGADPNVQDAEGFTALHIAAASQTSKPVTLILSKPGVNINMML